MIKELFKMNKKSFYGGVVTGAVVAAAGFAEEDSGGENPLAKHRVI